MIESGKGEWLDWSRAGFEAARQLLAHPDPARRHHGHSFALEMRVARGATPGANWCDHLASLAERLDYRDLNACLNAVDDHDILDWFVQHLGVSPRSSWLSAGARQGGIRDAQGNHYHWFLDRFEASHFLPQVPAGHKCGRLHGHGFEVVLMIPAAQDRLALRVAWTRLRERLHEHCLNDLAGLECPTSEMLAAWIWRQLVAQDIPMAQVDVFETGSCGSSYDGIRHRVWKRRSFDSALWRDDRRTGHTFVLNLGLSADMDETMGWIMDFGDIKQLFDPLYRELDHQPLHERGLMNSGEVLRWIVAQTGSRLPALDRVDLQETPTHGVIWQRSRDMSGLAR
ncbi:MAG: 6-carboxytetrahydropterin synthase [Betaproteobacteria bacterium]|jgi:6-pyruvoyl-tetrahydropterin synthase|nr:6-carboxytetrahydropterin synthase [Betaproteobacteria bacterium]